MPDSADVELRPTTAGDLGSLARLWNDGRVMWWVGYPNGLGISSSDLRRWHDRVRSDPRRHHFVVIGADGSFLGEAYYETAGSRAGLDIKLIPEAQGRGLGTAAFQALIEEVWASERDVDAVWTEPDEQNTPARRLYAKCGLRPRSRPDEVPGSGPYWELRRPS